MCRRRRMRCGANSRRSVLRSSGLKKSLGKQTLAGGPAGFALTEEGRILYECISEVYAKVNRIPDSLDNASQELRGRLYPRTISNFVSTRFDKLLMTYTTRCPLVELHIEVATWEAISLAVLRSEVDVGIAQSTFSIRTQLRTG